MAFTKRFFADYKSYNDTDYHLEIWIDGNTTTASKITLGAGGPVISYDTDNEGRFNTILSSQMQVPIVCEDTAVKTFLTDLRETYQEQQVYVHLYQSTSANEDPLWSGFVLMDLSSQEDVDQPYVATITATDGLSLLKDRDWVGSGATKPYDENDMYWGPGRFTYWLSQALQKTGMGGTSTGAYADVEFRTSVNWYNADHAAPSQSNDPLYNTKGKMSWTHKKDSGGNFTVMSTYDVLKEILKTWGCRITYWKHVFWIVQIPEYIITDSGTFANPDNINTRVYSLSGGVLGDRAYLGGTAETRYQLVTGGTAANPGLQKLSGSKYDFYPRLKTLTAQFISGGGVDYFGGFPTYDGTILVSPISQQTIVDAAYAGYLYLKIPLKLQQTYSATSTFTIKFDLKATNGTITKYLKSNGTWQATIPATVDKPNWHCAAITGTSSQIVVGFNQNINTHSDFTGAWEFDINVDDTLWGTASSLFTGVDPNIGMGSFFLDPSAIGLTWFNVPSGGGAITTSVDSSGATTFTTLGGNPFEGSFLCLNSSSGVNIYGQNWLIETSTTDSETQDLKQIRWGDTLDTTDLASLQVWDGSAWVQTDFAGEWGVGIITGIKSMTDLLLTQHLNGQASNIQIINTRLVLSEFGKTETDGTSDYMKYVNPIGKIREAHDGADDIYVFRRGKFNTLMDEWDYEGWIIKDESPASTSTSTTVYYNGLPIETDSGVAGARLANPNVDPTVMARNGFFTQTSAEISGVTTSITIDSIGVDLFVAGDVILLAEKYGNRIFSLEVNATQSGADRSIAIVSYDFGSEPIMVGALITHDEIDLVKQYQNKTRGTVGGMVVTSDSIDGAKSIGRQQVFFRCDGSVLSEGNYYVLNGEDNNRSGRFSPTNTAAPANISTQRAIKSCQFICDGDYKIESGTSVMTGTNGWDVEMHLYKTTPVDGTVGNTAMTLIGKYSISLALDSRTQIDALTDISSEVINAGDIIIPHIIAPVIGASSSFNFRAGITFTLIRV